MALYAIPGIYFRMRKNRPPEIHISLYWLCRSSKVSSSDLDSEILDEGNRWDEPNPRGQKIVHVISNWLTMMTKIEFWSNTWFQWPAAGSLFLNIQVERCCHRFCIMKVWLSCAGHITIFLLWRAVLSAACSNIFETTGIMDGNRGNICAKWPVVIVALNWANNHHTVLQCLGRTSSQLI